MFCPSCGAEERQPTQFCRACGADVRAVRLALEEPDSISASAVRAREEIGRAIAFRISELRTGKELAKVAEEVLPQIEKFLEPPEDRRLRRIRAGVIMSALGLGGTIFLLLFEALTNEGIPWPAGLVPFFLGLALIINGIWLTVPRPRVREHHYDRSRSLLDGAPISKTAEIDDEAGRHSRVASVTENTTKHLDQMKSRRTGEVRQ
jgi:hypothetical protein